MKSKDDFKGMETMKLFEKYNYYRKKRSRLYCLAMLLRKYINHTNTKLTIIMKSLFPMLYTRPMIKFIRMRNNTGKEMTGVEIGVWKGHNAKSILMELPIKKLYLIDPYETYIQNGEEMSFSTSTFEEAQKRLIKFKDNILFIRSTSEGAAGHIPNNLDFVYIDGNHDYRHVKKDIELYYPKVRLGGVLGGHDFRIGDIGLCRAVLEFVGKNNLELHGLNTDWWVVKG